MARHYFPNRDAAGSRAVGLLEVLIEFDRIPEPHATRARNIIAQWREREGDSSKWDDDADHPYPPAKSMLTPASKP